MNWEVIFWTCATVGVIAVSAILIFSLISSRNLKKHFNKTEEMHKNIAIGCEAICCGGIYGIVVGVNEKTVNVEIAKDTVITVSKYSVQTIFRN